MDIRRPKVSRETRSLLIILIVSITVLWGLARLRFPERPVSPNPLPPVLAQLAPASPLESFAAAVRNLEPKVLPALVSIRAGVVPGGSTIGLRLPDGLAAAFSDESLNDVEPAQLVARDHATGLSIFALSSVEPVSVHRRWTPNAASRFLLAAAVSRDRLFLRPAFIGSFTPAPSPPWGTEVWALPDDAGIGPGTFLFTTEGTLAGAAVSVGEGIALVPADVLTSAALQLSAQAPTVAASLGVEVQPLTPSLSQALSAKSGVVVTWVDPDGPAADRLHLTDVVEAVNEARPDDQSAWDAIVSRLPIESDVRLKVRRGGTELDVLLQAVRARPIGKPRSSGLTLRTVAAVGAEVIGVERGSAAHRAGFHVGDVVTRIADRTGPAPAAITRTLSATPDGGFVVFVVRRGNGHHVLALERTW